MHSFKKNVFHLESGRFTCDISTPALLASSLMVPSSSSILFPISSTKKVLTYIKWWLFWNLNLKWLRYVIYFCQELCSTFVQSYFASGEAMRLSWRQGQGLHWQRPVGAARVLGLAGVGAVVPQTSFNVFLLSSFCFVWFLLFCFRFIFNNFKKK